MAKSIGLWSTLKRWLDKKFPRFWSYVSLILVRTSLFLVVRCNFTSFCLKFYFASLRFRRFALIWVLCRFIKFTMTCFLMIASGSLVISRCKFRALDQIQIQLKLIRKPFDRASLNFLSKTLQRSQYFRAGLIFKLFLCSETAVRIIFSRSWNHLIT